MADESGVSFYSPLALKVWKTKIIVRIAAHVLRSLYRGTHYSLPFGRRS